MKRTMLFFVALICLLVSSAYCAETAKTVVADGTYAPTVYKICIDGLLFYAMSTVNGKSMVQVFQPASVRHLPPQPKECIGN